MILNISEQEIQKCKGWSFENIYFFIMMLYLGMATGYTQVLCYPPSKGLWTFFIPILLTYFLIKRNKKCFRNTSVCFKALLVVIVWIVAQYFKYGKMEPMNIFLLYNICMAFVFCRVYGMRSFAMYEKCLVILAALSLPVWALYTLTPETMLSLFSVIGIKCEGTLEYSGILCNLASSQDFLGFRNVGFAQEPGHWASFLIIGMFINLLINDFNYRNKSFFILLAALITSQSTTGYSSFGIILLMIIFSAKRSRIFLIVASIFVIPSVVALPFMREKIEKYAYTNESVENARYNGEYLERNDDNAIFVPQRMDGFAFELMNFVNDPLMGYGIKETNSFISKTVSSRISCSNGNIKVFSKYGLFLAILFYSFLFKTGDILVSRKRKLVLLSWIILYLALGMSYEFTTIPLLLSFWIFSLLGYTKT